MKTQRVKDWMTPNPICISPETPLPDAHKLMTDNRIRRLPVVDAKGRLLGIVTRGDIRGAEPSEATSLSVFEIHYLLSRLTIDRIMSKDPVSISPEATLHEAANQMLKHKIAGLPVVEGERIVGIITESDIFRMVVKTWAQEDAGVSKSS